MNLDDQTLLRTDSYVNGAWTAAPGDRRFAVTNPATGSIPPAPLNFRLRGGVGLFRHQLFRRRLIRAEVSLRPCPAADSSS